jgi:hypothetical protein
LASYKFKIYYRKENKNGKTDALNRRSDYLIKKGKEPAAIFKINNQETISCNINFIAEITKYIVESVTKIIRDFYNNTTAGYKEVTQIFNKIRRTSIQLSKILEKIREYIAACDIYSRIKYRRYKPYKLIKSPDVPDGP